MIPISRSSSSGTTKASSTKLWPRSRPSCASAWRLHRQRPVVPISFRTRTFISGIFKLFAVWEQYTCHQERSRKLDPKPPLRSTKGYKQDLEAFTFEDATESPTAPAGFLRSASVSSKRLFAYILQRTSL